MDYCFLILDISKESPKHIAYPPLNEDDIETISDQLTLTESDQLILTGQCIVLLVTIEYWM